MSTQPDSKKAVRSKESLIAELILCKKLGWKIGFISGGIGAFSHSRFKEVISDMHKVSGEKFWLNIGALSEKELKDLLPYTCGVVGSIETVNRKIHDKVCPSKPIEPYLKMFSVSSKLGLKNVITIIIGLGESIDDFAEFEKIVKKYKIVKVHFYGLNPQKGTVFENCKPPTEEYQAEWISKTREKFPSIDIQCGIWLDRVDRVGTLLKAGANSISKFPALNKFGSKEAFEIEKQAKLAGREFVGTLTKLPLVDWDSEVNKLKIDPELKKKVLVKLEQYLKKMK
jgi:biotin synthase-like enzyme